MLTLYPVSKASILECLDKEVGPLAKVRALELMEEKITEEQLSTGQSVVFKFLKNSYLKCFKIAPDQKFLAYLQFLEQNFKI